MRYSLPIEIQNLRFYEHRQVFPLELGGSLPELTIGYHTYGTLNGAADNIIWVCHALTANSDVSDWWAGLFGAGNVLDPDKYFIVCANILGSCYGSTCARSISPRTGKAYGTDFPAVTLRDMARAHDLLRRHLGIRSVDLCIGGSCGGHQVLEFAALTGDLCKRLVLLVCGARESAWVIGTHEAQRLAIEADPTWRDDDDRGGAAGLRAARGAALLTYRTFQAYLDRQTDTGDKTNNLRAATYIRYQGKKLERRFYAQAYYALTKALDTYHIGRGRGGIAAALRALTMPTLIISIDSDLLIPPSQQRILADNMPNAHLEVISSPYGHDGFLLEFEKIKTVVGQFLGEETSHPV